MATLGCLRGGIALAMAVLLAQSFGPPSCYAQTTSSPNTSPQPSYLALLTNAFSSGQFVSPLLACGVNGTAARGFQDCAAVESCQACLSNTSRGLALQLSDQLVADTTALADLCSRQPKASISFQIMLGGSSWFNGPFLAAAGSRAPWYGQMDVGLPILPIPSSNLTYTECGKIGGPNGPPVSTVEGGVSDIQGNSIEHSAAVYTGTAPSQVSPPQFWENTEFGVIANSTGLPFGMVFPRTQLLLLYRADWFAELGVSPPATWEELIQLAAALSRAPGFHATRHSAGRDDGAGTEQGPRLNYTRTGYNFTSWPAEGSLPSVLDLLREGPALTNTHLSKRWPLCLDLGLYCKSSDLLAAITSSIMQANGTAQNPYLDPTTLRPLVDGPAAPAFKHALQIHRALAALATPDVPGLENVTLESCSVINRVFAAGSCAMTIDWDAMFPFLYGSPFLRNDPLLGRPGDVPGNVGFAPLPGSARVLDRAAGALVPCDAAMCPHARAELVTTYTSGAALPESNSSSSSSVSQEPLALASYPRLGAVEQYGVVRRSSAARVNRAPFSAQLSGFDAFSCSGPGINQELVGAIQQFMLSSLVPSLSLLNVMSGAFRGPYMQANATGYFQHPYFSNSNGSLQARGRRIMRDLMQFEPSGVAVPPPLPSFEPYLAGWTFGILPPPVFNITLNTDDSRRFFEASWRSRFQYKDNQAPQIVLPKQPTAWYRMTVEQALMHFYTSADATTSSLAQGIVSRAEYIFGISGPATVRQMLWQTTGYIPPVIPAPEDKKSDNKAGLIAAIVVPVSVALLMALAALAALYYVQSSRHKTLLGQIRPPKAGPQTTLLLTDIQDSTTLWEALPEAVIDASLSLHHDIIRKVAALHRGYESATEGDAFVIAFHSAQDAVLFAVDAQQALAYADWPEPLLDTPICKPVWVCPSSVAAKGRPESGQVPDEDMAGGGGTVNSLFSGYLKSHAGSFALRNTLSSRFATGLDGNASFGGSLSQLKIFGSMFRENNKSGARDRERDNSVQPRTNMPSLTFSEQAYSTTNALVSPRSSIGQALASPKAGNTISTAMLEAGDKPPCTATIMSVSSVDDGTNPSARQSHSELLPGRSADDALGGRSGLPERALGEQLALICPSADGPGPGRVLLFRGLRVRMGMASGVESSADVALNYTAGRVKYSGSCLLNSKATIDAAPGAMVLVSASTFTQLAMEPLKTPVMVMHMGDHCMEDGHEAHPLYQILPGPMVWRAAYFNPLRTTQVTSLGCLQAPCALAAVCFMHAMGLNAVMATDADLGKRSAAVYHHVVQTLLYQAGGYLVEGSDGLIVASFGRPVRAARWALDAIVACLHAAWPEELLMHEVGEVVSISVAPPPEAAPARSARAKGGKAHLQQQPVQQILFRGLRIKCGVDYGAVMTDIAPSTGRATYRGKVVSRASRMFGMVKSGQVVMSNAAWDLAAVENNAALIAGTLPPEKEIVGTALGAQKLRGVSEEVELVQCYYRQQVGQIGNLDSFTTQMRSHAGHESGRLPAPPQLGKRSPGAAGANTMVSVAAGAEIGAGTMGSDGSTGATIGPGFLAALESLGVPAAAGAHSSARRDAGALTSVPEAQ